MPDILALGGLFTSAFLAATIIPAQSEIVLGGLLLTGRYDTALLVLIATLGNVLGACVNWLLGKYVGHFQHRRWFPVKKEALEKAATTYQRYGTWTLLFSWVPIVGDALTVIAGVLRTNFILFVVLVTAGKLARYIAIVTMLQ